MTIPFSPSTPREAASQKARGQNEQEGVRETKVMVAGQSARVYVGGRGERLLLIHGGWGGARMHWASVWGRLTEHFEVIAPDLPGIGRTDQAALGSVGAYAEWLDMLLDALDVPNAWCVGNSFGASVAWRLAADHSERCRGLVLVNGFPIPTTPRLLRWLGERRLGHRLMRILEKRIAYSPAALKRGFSDPARAPEELRNLLQTASPPQVDAFVDILVQGGGSPARCHLPSLLVWGEDDHLPGTSARQARNLQASLPGSKLALVPGAGHMPQVENPAAFVEALVSFIAPPA